MDQDLPFLDVYQILSFCFRFLPVDMHMYILACALTLLLWRRRCLAVKIYLVLLVASCLLIAVVVYINDYKTLTLLATPE